MGDATRSTRSSAVATIVLGVLVVLLAAATITLSILLARVAKRKPAVHVVRVQEPTAKKDQKKPPSKDPVVKRDTDLFVMGRALAAPVTDDLLAEKAMCPFQVIVSLTSSPKRIANVSKIL
jgi:hypothetical protein